MLSALYTCWRATPTFQVTRVLLMMISAMVLSKVCAAGLALQIGSKWTVSASSSMPTFKTSLSVCGSLSRCASTFTHLIWRRRSFLYTALVSLSKSASDPACIWRVANLWLNHFLTPASASEILHPAVIRPLAQPLVTR